MTERHTPGPWSVHVAYDGDGVPMLYVDQNIPAAPQDMRLMSAAPELCSALKEAAGAIALVADQYTGQSQRDLLAVRDIARAAIAKATA